MRVYAERSGMALRQALTDLAVLAWTWLWLEVGQIVHRFVAAFAAPARQLERAGRELTDIGQGAIERVEGLPLVGDVLRGPFEAVVSGGRSLVQAGVEQQESVATAALWLGLLTAVIPIVVVLLLYLPRRLRWIRAAGSARRLLDAGNGQALLALRALANQPLSRLRRADPDPWGAFRRGDHQRLADLELRSLGLSAPPSGRRLRR